ncbi:MAG TPA: ABC transporter ATP-binding protein [Caldimonas sp.]|jgi:iron(III) transport system ATP-binding protein|nr:ABC transporter ATP-binding protein [Caldimonas sp.]HEX2543141.1 ABC transporter ATP-binding protein [Caldimonas sp.]
MSAVTSAPFVDAPAKAFLPVLSLLGVAHRYGASTTFADLDLALASGEVCCLLGPSGCGKTTALRCIAGFERVTAGTISIDGSVVSRAGGRHVPPERRRIGMVFQDLALFPHLTVARNVAFGIADRSRAGKRVAEMLAAVGLEWAGDRLPHELSGGQQQRVALARALAPAPRLLLLDEPFSSLDAGLREELAADVRAILKAAGTTAVFVTHDQNEAFAMADRIAVMNEGRIQQIDSAYNLYHRPSNRFVADFIGQGVLVDATVLAPQRLGLEIAEVPCREPIRLAGSGTPCAPGDRIDVLLRPDDVIHDDSSPVKAMVRAKAFRGAEILYTLQLASGATVLALVPSHHNHTIDEPIGIRLELDHVIAFAPQRAPQAAPAVAAAAMR